MTGTSSAAGKAGHVASPLRPTLIPSDAVRVHDMLRRYWGYETLLPLQAEAIACALAGRDALTVLPTGGGKSLCYQMPPLLDGTLDVVVSPLISLMKDQVDGLRASGYPAAALHSGMDAAARRTVQASLHAREIRLLFVSPERLVMDEFVSMLQGLGVRRFAIDEAHCISQWGHDFRPNTGSLAILRRHFPDASVHAYTATATPRVREDIVQQLQLKDAALLVGRFDRPNLIYRVLPKTDMREQTAAAIARHAGEAAIVYCLSRKEHRIARGMAQSARRARGALSRRHGERRAAPHPGSLSPTKRWTWSWPRWRSGWESIGAMSAASYTRSLPKSIEHYQQETGRAGRDGLEAECVMFLLRRRRHAVEGHHGKTPRQRR